MSTLFNDIKLGVRILVKHPGVTVVALFTLALAIAMNVMTFTFVYAEQRVGGDFTDPQDLVFVWSTGRDREIKTSDYVNGYAQAESFTQTALFHKQSGFLAGGPGPQKVRVLKAESTLLPMLGLPVQAGRLFSEQDVNQNEGLVLISDRLWRRRYAADPGLIGQSILLDNTPRRVLGIVKVGTATDRLWRRADIVIPLNISSADFVKDEKNYHLLARLAPDIGFDQAQAGVSAMAERTAPSQSLPTSQKQVYLQSLKDYLSLPKAKLMRGVLLLAVGLVLIIACVNIAGIQMSRAVSRIREFTIRLALGAQGKDLLHQLLVENALLGILGAFSGLILARWTLRILLAIVTDVPYRPEELDLNLAVILYTAGVSLVATLIFGWLPAWRLAKLSPNEGLKEGRTGNAETFRTQRWRHNLVIGQLALSLPMLVCCGILIQHVRALWTLDLGYETDQVLTMRCELPAFRYADPQQQIGFAEKAIGHLAGLPGIRSVAVSSGLEAFGRPMLDAHLSLDNQTQAQDMRSFAALAVSPGYFQTLGIPLRQGRVFSERDRAAAPSVALVNQYLAGELWPEETPVGQHLMVALGKQAPRLTTVVGIVPNVGCSQRGGSAGPILYLPYAQHPQSRLTLVTQTQGDPQKLVKNLQSAIGSMDAQVPVYDMVTIKKLHHNWLRDEQVALWFLGLLGVSALGLAGIGLYGVMSYAVTQRTREVGIRLALGSTSRGVLVLVIKRCLGLASLGLTVGLMLAVPIGVALSLQCYRASAYDPLVYLTTIVVFLGIALLAGTLPARRAAKIEPMEALRYE